MSPESIERIDTPIDTPTDTENTTDAPGSADHPTEAFAAPEAVAAPEAAEAGQAHPQDAAQQADAKAQAAKAIEQAIRQCFDAERALIAMIESKLAPGLKIAIVVDGHVYQVARSQDGRGLFTPVGPLLQVT